jgi:menaquinone-9 beta-reductase
MTGRSFDVVIVGARCAGAALSTLLARDGMRVLVVDKSAMPSDQVLSTHTVHPPGVDILDELGVGDAVRTLAPPTRTVHIRKDECAADVSFGDGRAGYCPRRKRLDSLLQEAAVRAGAEIRDRSRAIRILVDDGRAAGVQIRHGNSVDKVAAPLVVGADGRRSFVAREVRAEEYMAYDAPRAMYWAYWDAPAAWRTDRYPFDMYLAAVGPDIRVIFQTDDDQLLVGSLPAVQRAQSWRRSPVDSLCRNLAEDAVIGPLLSGAAPDSSVRGTLNERYFFRQAAGPGWALVGDAGHHKDFVVGDGITEALLQAKSLARAIKAGGDDELQRWWRARDVAALPQYFWGRDEGSLDPPSELERAAFARIARDERLQRRITGLPEHRCSPYDVLPPAAVASCLAGALLRGRIRVIPDFLAQARRVLEYRRALKARQRLLDVSAGR